MQSHEYDTLRSVEERHWWHQILRTLVSRELRSRLPEKARVLDAGCGTGGMLARLHDEHPQWDVIGIDLEEAAVRHCQERGLDHVRLGDVADLPFESDSFDAVLGLDVLYHAKVDQERALSEMVRVLRPGGALVLNVPAFNCLRGSHDVAVCGGRRYKACQVRDLLESRNLSIEMIQYWNAWLFLPVLLRRQWSRLTVTEGQATASDLKMPTPWLNQLLSVVGLIDAAASRKLRLPWGTSVFAVAIETKRNNP